MSMSYKADLERCIEYLCKLRDAIEVKEDFTEADMDEREELIEYCKAIRAALDTVQYYEERDSILRARHGKGFVEELDRAWFELKKARINEMFGIGLPEGGGEEETDE